MCESSVQIVRGAADGDVVLRVLSAKLRLCLRQNTSFAVLDFWVRVWLAANIRTGNGMLNLLYGIIDVC